MKAREALSFLKNIWEEAKRQFFSVPSFALNSYRISPSHQHQLNMVNNQILAALEDNKKRIIFILAPYGAGKTTQVRYFMHKNPNFSYRYKSYIKVDSFDFAFLHLTGGGLRLLFLVTAIALSYMVFSRLPGAAVMPILLLLSLAMMKTFGHALYLFHEILDNLFGPKFKIIIIEDIERSTLSDSQRWEFLANLWQQQRAYIVTLGFSPEDVQKKFSLIEGALKLGGRVIQIPLNEEANFELIKKLDPDFPFSAEEEKVKGHGWLSLFTFREIYTLYEHENLKMLAKDSVDPLEKQLFYIEFSLQLLLGKLKLPNQEFIFDKEKREIKKPPLDKIEADQIHFIDSFCNTLSPELGITIVESPLTATPQNV